MDFGLKSSAINTFLNVGPRVNRWLHRRLATLDSRRRAVRFYWSAGSAYSYVMAQQLKTLTEQPDIHTEIEVVVVPMISGDVNPEPALRASHIPRDCADLADFYEIDFPKDWVAPRAALLDTGDRLVASTPTLAACIAAGHALWRGDEAALDQAASTYGQVDLAELNTLRQDNARAQRSAGHYQPGTAHYMGEWFEGPLRVRLVAERLGGPPAASRSLWARRPDPQLPRESEGTVEVWSSFRSPYSYLALAQLQRWRDAGEHVDVCFRPLLPMVMRGLPVPRAKKMYLVKDAAREARRLNIPFGRVADPVGEGAERCLAVCAALIKADGGESTARAFDFAVAASQGIWSEGIDVATDKGLIQLAGRAGVSEDEVMAGLADSAAGAALADTNRKLLNAIGVWGVPSFRVGEFVTWGQDRLPLLRHVLGLD